MGDKSSRPHRSPDRTPQPLVRRIVHLRWKHRLGPVQIAARTRPGCLPPSTRSWSAAGSTACPASTGSPASRSAATSTSTPARLVHVDVKKLGNVPDGGGWRYVGRAQGKRNKTAAAHRTGQREPDLPPPAERHGLHPHRPRRPLPRRLRPRSATTRPGKPRSRCSATRPPGSPPAASRIERVLSDNGSCYRSQAVAAACAELGITPKKTRPYRLTPDQRQDRALPPHPGRRMGLQKVLLQRLSPPRRTTRPGSTNTITTGPTPHSGTQRPSPG